MHPALNRRVIMTGSFTVTKSVTRAMGAVRMIISNNNMFTSQVQLNHHRRCRTESRLPEYKGKRLARRLAPKEELCVAKQFI